MADPLATSIAGVHSDPDILGGVPVFAGTRVPVRALLALSEGGYAVETVRNGIRKLVAVELGAFADGFVEITGRVQPGTKVVVPS